MKYFNKLPNVKYSIIIDGEKSTLELTSLNTTATFTDITLNNADAFYPYETDNGERIDDIANMYYGDSYRFWIVMMSNQMSDFYYELPLDLNTFDRYIVKKYKDAAEDNGYDVSSDIKVIQYTKDTIKYYYDADGDIIDLETYNTLSTLNRSSKTIYDWEVEENDNKRNIDLVSNKYTNTVERQFKDLMKRK